MVNNVPPTSLLGLLLVEHIVQNNQDCGVGYRPQQGQVPCRYREDLMKQIKELRKKLERVMLTPGIFIWEEEIGFLPTTGGLN